MLVKLANKLTKIFNTLSDQAQERGASLLRPESTFIKGIEKGNRKLLSALQKREKKSFKFINPKEHSGSFDPSTFIMKAKKHPKTLNDAIIKRHEIWEAQQSLGHKNIDKKLIQNFKKAPKFEKRYNDLIQRKNKINNYLNSHTPYKRVMESMYKVEDEISHDFMGSHTPEREKTLYKRLDTLQKYLEKDTKYQKYQKIKEKLDSQNNTIRSALRTTYDDPHSKFWTHTNPQVLINESNLIKTTPNAFKTKIYEYRHEQRGNVLNEADDLKRSFNINYFKR